MERCGVESPAGCRVSGCGERASLESEGNRCYLPDNTSRREQFVFWTFTPVFDKDSPAVAGIMQMTRSKDAFPFGVDTSIGSSSWSWPEDVPSKQKLVSFKKFNPEEELFKRGAHAPLMVFLGAGNEARRSKEALRRRAANADSRGWELGTPPVNEGQRKGQNRSKEG